MGHGIAQVSAQAGFKVVAIETSPEFLERGMNRIDGSLDKVFARDVKKGNISADEAKAQKATVMARITKSTNIADIHDCDMVVEAIIEDMPTKLEFYKNLKQHVKPSCILGSNTSSLQIGAMADVSGHANNFVGLHFFNPVQIMKLVEVVKTDKTSPETLEAVNSFAKKIGKSAVTCTDTPGFVVNRLLVPYLAQAMAMVDRNVASVPDIDLSMRLGAGHPMGPLHLADYIGLDTCLSILKGWVKEFPDEQAFFIPKILETMIADGHYGRKTGQGFYEWDGDQIRTKE